MYSAVWQLLGSKKAQLWLLDEAQLKKQVNMRLYEPLVSNILSKAEAAGVEVGDSAGKDEIISAMAGQSKIDPTYSF